MQKQPQMGFLVAVIVEEQRAAVNALRSGPQDHVMMVRLLGVLVCVMESRRSFLRVQDLKAQMFGFRIESRTVHSPVTFPLIVRKLQGFFTYWTRRRYTPTTRKQHCRENTQDGFAHDFGLGRTVKIIHRS